MSPWEWGLIGLLGFAALQQLGAIGLFLLRSRPQDPGSRAETPPTFPPAVVVLPIRGGDERLRETCRGLRSQSYPHLSIRIILDDPEGTVEPLLTEEIGDDPRFEIVPLEDPLDTCGLKNSAVLQATRELPVECEFVAFIDSDVVPQARWLEELVRPLANGEADCSYGCRWYALKDRRLGSVWRYGWCAASLVSTLIRNVPWGGSLAVRKTILEEPPVRELWAKCGCEDLPLSRYLRKSGRSLKCLPQLLLVEQSSCSVADYRRFVGRQMLWTRLYRPDAFWPVGVLYLSLAMSLWGLTGFAIGRLVQRDFLAFGSLAAVLTVYVALALVLMALIERRARRFSPELAIQSKRLGFRGSWATIVAAWLVPDMFLRALLTRRLTWRGVNYDVSRPYGIRVLSDDSHQEPSSKASPPRSRKTRLQRG